MFDSLNVVISPLWQHTVVYFLGVVAVIKFIRSVTKDTDVDLAPEKLKELSDKLIGINVTSYSVWIPNFTLVFDNFFGSKHLSFKCFYRSSFISIFTFFSLIYILDFNRSRSDFVNADLEGFLGVVAISILFNVVVDYISLLETRLVLSTRLPIFFKITIDAVFTLMLPLMWFGCILYFLSFESYIGAFLTSFEIFFGSGDYSEPGLIEFIRIIVATSFTTSIWLWLHGLAQIFIRCLSPLEFFVSYLNVKNTPVRATGVIVNFIFTFISIIAFPFSFALLD